MVGPRRRRPGRPRLHRPGLGPTTPDVEAPDRTARPLAPDVVPILALGGLVVWIVVTPSVLRPILTVTGAVALYCAVTAALWLVVMRVGRRRAVRAAARATASRDGTGERRSGSWEGIPPVGRERRARDREELPGWLWRDRPWAVAVVLLGAPAVRDKTAPFVDFPNRTIDWNGLLTRSDQWPPDQRPMVRSAHEMAFGSPDDPRPSAPEPLVTLQDLVRHMSEDEMDRIRMAMQIRTAHATDDHGAGQ